MRWACLERRRAKRRQDRSRLPDAPLGEPTGEHDHDRAVEVISPKVVRPDMEFEEFCHLVLSVVRGMEVHETDEWFQVDGERLVDPDVLHPMAKLESTVTTNEVS